MQPPDEVMQRLLEIAREARNLHLPRPGDLLVMNGDGTISVIDQPACPLCNEKLIVRNAELICVSEICRERKIESCDGC